MGLLCKRGVLDWRRLRLKDPRKLVERETNRFHFKTSKKSSSKFWKKLSKVSGYSKPFLKLLTQKWIRTTSKTTSSTTFGYPIRLTKFSISHQFPNRFLIAALSLSLSLGHLQIEQPIAKNRIQLNLCWCWKCCWRSLLLAPKTLTSSTQNWIFHRFWIIPKICIMLNGYGARKSNGKQNNLIPAGALPFAHKYK